VSANVLQRTLALFKPGTATLRGLLQTRNTTTVAAAIGERPKGDQDMNTELAAVEVRRIPPGSARDVFVSLR
jgi:hypothetical protein